MPQIPSTDPAKKISISLPASILAFVHEECRTHRRRSRPGKKKLAASHYFQEVVHEEMERVAQQKKSETEGFPKLLLAAEEPAEYRTKKSVS